MQIIRLKIVKNNVANHNRTITDVNLRRNALHVKGNIAWHVEVSNITTNPSARSRRVNIVAID